MPGVWLGWLWHRPLKPIRRPAALASLSHDTNYRGGGGRIECRGYSGMSVPNGDNGEDCFEDQEDVLHDDVLREHVDQEEVVHDEID